MFAFSLGHAIGGLGQSVSPAQRRISAPRAQPKPRSRSRVRQLYVQVEVSQIGIRLPLVRIVVCPAGLHGLTCISFHASAGNCLDSLIAYKESSSLELKGDFLFMSDRMVSATGDLS